MTAETPDAFFARRAEAHGGWRRHLHQNPELGFEERATAAFLLERLREMGIEDIATGIGGTGIVATLHGNAPGGTIGLRADMDALPIPEETNVPHRSRNEGVSHACGHDGHMAMLLAAADYLAQARDFAGTVRFIFQPAEETGGGGRRMVEEGLFERFPVDAVFGLHNWPGLPLGNLAAKAGPVMAAMDLFSVRIEGRGAHAAMPHLGTDTIVAASAFISGVQTIVSRSVAPVAPAVVSLTQIHGGQSLNALPAEVELRGTVRVLANETRDKVRDGIDRIAAGVRLSHGVDVDIRYQPNYPVTVNAAAPTRYAVDVARALWGNERVVSEYEPSMASEDFAYMLEAKEGCYVWLGIGSDIPLHSPAFDFDDSALPLGAAYWVALVRSREGACGQ